MDSGSARSRICPECRARFSGDAVFCPEDGQLLMDLSLSAVPGAEPAAPADEEPSITPGLMLGDYQIEYVLASGGMGVVYAGVHPLIRKRVAIKVINRRFAADKKAVARFVLEARSVNEIGHHNIVDIFAIGELDDGRNYLVMELIDGVGLHEGLHAVGRFRPGELLPVYEQLCDALETAHHKGFIHRDIKPENVLVLRRPPYPLIKILDFGLAKLRGGSQDGPGVEQTVVGTVVGTPAYMAPEQCRGGAVDARTDVYAMGVMLFELLTGERPFGGSTQHQIMMAQLTVQAPAPSTIVPELPAALDEVTLKALSKDPDRRQPSARAFFAELERAIGAPAVWPHRALPPPPSEIPRRPVAVLRPEPISDVILTEDDDGETRRTTRTAQAAGALAATLPPPESMELVIGPSYSDERPVIAKIPVPSVDGPDSDAMLHQLEAMLEDSTDEAHRRTLPMPLLDVPDSAVQGSPAHPPVAPEAPRARRPPVEGPADPPGSLPAAPRVRRASAGAAPVQSGQAPNGRSTARENSTADQSTGPVPGRPPVSRPVPPISAAPAAPAPPPPAAAMTPDTLRTPVVNVPRGVNTWESMAEETFVPGALPSRPTGRPLIAPWIWVAVLAVGVLVGVAAYLILR
jgi:serine/threonine-protein kinase